MAREGTPPLDEEFWKDLKIEDRATFNKRCDYIFKKMKEQIWGLWSMSLMSMSGLSVYESERKMPIYDEVGKKVSEKDITEQDDHDFYGCSYEDIMYKTHVALKDKSSKMSSITMNFPWSTVTTVKLDCGSEDMLVAFETNYNSPIWEYWKNSKYIDFSKYIIETVKRSELNRKG